MKSQTVRIFNGEGYKSFICGGSSLPNGAVAKMERNPDGFNAIALYNKVNAIYEGMKAKPAAIYTSQQNHVTPGYSPAVVALMAKGWDKLDRSGELANVKAIDEKAFNALYKEKFGWYPGENPQYKRG